MASGLDDGTSNAHGIARAARGGVDNQSVGLIGGQVFAIHVHANADHRRDVALEHGHLIQRKGISLGLSVVVSQLEHTAVFYLIVPGIDLLDGRRELRRRNVGEETQTASVDSDDGNLLGTYAAGSLQKRAVAAHGDGDVGFETVVVQHLRSCRNGYLQVVGQIVVECFLDEQLGLALLEQAEQFLHGG